jgi:hypothetical protein
MKFIALFGILLLATAACTSPAEEEFNAQVEKSCFKLGVFGGLMIENKDVVNVERAFEIAKEDQELTQLVIDAYSSDLSAGEFAINAYKECLKENTYKKRILENN